MKQDTKQLFNQDVFFENITALSKAHAYDIVSAKALDLEAENIQLKERVKFLEDLINEYTGKMLAHLSNQ
jgi:hypothetical protein